MKKRRLSLPPTTLKPVPHSVMKPPPVGAHKLPPAGKLPNPRRPQFTRDVGGGVLKDLFAFFPDLPRPPRPAARQPLRRGTRVRLRLRRP